MKKHLENIERKTNANEPFLSIEDKTVLSLKIKVEKTEENN